MEQRGGLVGQPVGQLALGERAELVDVDALARPLGDPAPERPRQRREDARHGLFEVGAAPEEPVRLGEVEQVGVDHRWSSIGGVRPACGLTVRLRSAMPARPSASTSKRRSVAVNHPSRTSRNVWWPRVVADDELGARVADRDGLDGPRCQAVGRQQHVDLHGPHRVGDAVPHHVAELEGGAVGQQEVVQAEAELGPAGAREPAVVEAHGQVPRPPRPVTVGERAVQAHLAVTHADRPGHPARRLDVPVGEVGDAPPPWRLRVEVLHLQLDGRAVLLDAQHAVGEGHPPLVGAVAAVLDVRPVAGGHRRPRHEAVGEPPRRADEAGAGDGVEAVDLEALLEPRVLPQLGHAVRASVRSVTGHPPRIPVERWKSCCGTKPSRMRTSWRPYRAANVTVASR